KMIFTLTLLKCARVWHALIIFPSQMALQEKYELADIDWHINSLLCVITANPLRGWGQLFISVYNFQHGTLISEIILIAIAIFSLNFLGTSGFIFFVGWQVALVICGTYYIHVFLALNPLSVSVTIAYHHLP
ncbi:hypothetical protein ACJX0J_019809, partial [Zea mays]